MNTWNNQRMHVWRFPNRDVVLGTRTRVQLEYKFEVLVLVPRVLILVASVLVLVLVVDVLVYYATLLIGSVL